MQIAQSQARKRSDRLTVLKFQVTSEVHGRQKVKSQLQVLAYAMAGDFVVVTPGTRMK